MSTRKKSINVAILDDNPFYCDVLEKQILNYLKTPVISNDFDPKIETFTSPKEFMDSINSSTDIAFVDFYLGDSLTGIELSDKIKKKAWDCEVVMVSSAADKKMKEEVDKKSDYDGLVQKGEPYSIPECCTYIDEIVERKKRRPRMI